MDFELIEDYYKRARSKAPEKTRRRKNIWPGWIPQKQLPQLLRKRGYWMVKVSHWGEESGSGKGYTTAVLQTMFDTLMATTIF